MFIWKEVWDMINSLLEQQTHIKMEIILKFKRNQYSKFLLIVKIKISK